MGQALQLDCWLIVVKLGIDHKGGDNDERSYAIGKSEAVFTIGNDSRTGCRQALRNGDFGGYFASIALQELP